MLPTNCRRNLIPTADHSNPDFPSSQERATILKLPSPSKEIATAIRNFLSELKRTIVELVPAPHQIRPQPPLPRMERDSKYY